jgi:hypothetical protein
MAKGAAHVCFSVPGNGFGMAFVFVTAGRHPAAMPGGPATERWYNVNAQRGYAAGSAATGADLMAAGVGGAFTMPDQTWIHQHRRSTAQPPCIPSEDSALPPAN